MGKQKAVQYFAIFGLGVCMLLPGIQMVLKPFSPAKLGGVELTAKFPRWKFAAMARGDYTKSLGKWFSSNLGLRPWLVRLDNQVYYSLFGEFSPASTIVLGKNGHLFQSAVIDYHNNVAPVPRAKLVKFADKLRALQKRLGQRGIGFLLLITPAKTSIYPEYLPEDTLSPRSSSKSAYENLRPLLSGVPVLDAVEYYRAWKNKEPDFPLYHRTGTHWNYQSACRFSNHLLRRMETLSRRTFPRSNCSQQQVFPAQVLNDRDLLDVANLLREKPFLEKASYPLIGKEIEDQRNVYRPNVLYIGDSFMWQILYYMDSIRAHRRRSVYYYFRRDYRFPENSNAPIIRSELNWQREVFARDLVVLEINEIHLASLGFGFVDEALKQLQ